MKIIKVFSKDGTSIAFDKVGEGSPVILVGGALGTRSHPMFTRLVELLAEDFTVFNYDRRGRGDSGDTYPYAVEREIEDLEALIDFIGETASLYGISSGAVLALEAANKLPTKVKKLVLYEPPFILDDSRPPLPENFVAHINELVRFGERSEAVEFFMTDAIRIPAEYIALMKNDPSWAEMEKIAHTLAYDVTIMQDYQRGKALPPNLWASVNIPTLVVVGGNSEPFYHTGGQALLKMLPQGQSRILEGQDHAVASKAIAPLIKEFFS
jgi:pimeloyl-ACP methyl ester carboxylesterase